MMLHLPSESEEYGRVDDDHDQHWQNELDEGRGQTVNGPEGEKFLDANLELICRRKFSFHKFN